MPYIHAQGYGIGRDIEIFMPIYDGSLHELLTHFQKMEEWGAIMRATTDQMLRQILSALDFFHNPDRPVVHRDIKPANILYRGDQFFLADFGIAKYVDTSNTGVGTLRYIAPEVHSHNLITTKADIYSLGVTVLECLVGLPKPKGGDEESKSLKSSLAAVAPEYASMLAINPDDRPSAHELLRMAFPAGAPQSEDPPLNVGWPTLAATPSASSIAGFTQRQPAQQVLETIPEAQEPDLPPVTRSSGAGVPRGGGARGRRRGAGSRGGGAGGHGQGRRGPQNNHGVKHGSSYGAKSRKTPRGSKRRGRANARKK